MKESFIPVDLNGSCLYTYTYCRAQNLWEQLQKKSELYRSNVVLMPHGDDFRYDNGEEWEKQLVNMEKLMRYMSEHETMNIDVIDSSSFLLLLLLLLQRFRFTHSIFSFHNQNESWFFDMHRNDEQQKKVSVKVRLHSLPKLTY